MAGASVLVLAGILLDRFLFVTAGQIAPVTAGAGTVAYPYAAYTPTMVEIAILVGAGAFMAFFYTLAERYLNMGEGDTHLFFSWPWLRKHDHDGHAEEAQPAELQPDSGTPVAASQRTAQGAG
jgi:hypothetical protein